jgi:hypothetical protein
MIMDLNEGQDYKTGPAQVTSEVLAHPCLLRHYSQKPSYGNSQDAPLLTNVLRKRGIYAQWNGIVCSHEEE